MDDAVAMAVFEEARRLLIRQEADLDTLRARTVTLVSAAAVTAGLFAARLPEELSDFATTALVVAVAAFAATVLAAIQILRPTDFAFSHGLHKWVDDLRQARDVSITDWAYNVSRDLLADRAENQNKIRTMYKWMAAMCVLLGVQVAAWLAAVI